MDFDDFGCKPNLRPRMRTLRTDLSCTWGQTDVMRFGYRPKLFTQVMTSASTNILSGIGIIRNDGPCEGQKGPIARRGGHYSVRHDPFRMRRTYLQEKHLDIYRELRFDSTHDSLHDYTDFTDFIDQYDDIDVDTSGVVV